MVGELIAGLTNAQRQPVKEVDILWITAGLECDGDTIAMTAATQPSNPRHKLRGPLA